MQFLLLLTIFLLPSLLLSATTYQSINIFEPKYEAYLKAVNKSVTTFKYQYSNRDTYMLIDVLNSTLSSNENIGSLEVYVLMQTFKYYNITQVGYFAYSTNMGIITSQTDSNEYNAGWTDQSYLKSFNTTETMVSLLCQNLKICGQMQVFMNVISGSELNKCTAAYFKIPKNDGAFHRYDYENYFFKVQLGCRFIDNSTNLKYYVSIYCDAKGGDSMFLQTQISSFNSFYFVDYRNMVVKAFDSEKKVDAYVFTENKEKNAFISNMLFDLFQIKKDEPQPQPQPIPVDPSVVPQPKNDSKGNSTAGPNSFSGLLKNAFIILALMIFGIIA